MKTRLVLEVLALLLAAVSAWANGEPTGEFGEGGSLVPITVERAQIEVVNEKLSVDFPSPVSVWTYSDPPRAIIRAEYNLRVTSTSPVNLDIGFPIAPVDVYSKNTPNSKKTSAKITLDGKALPYKFLTDVDLQKPIIKAWLAELSGQLRDHPEVLQQANAIRKTSGISKEGAEQLAKWLSENTASKELRTEFLRAVATGMLEATTTDWDEDMDIRDGNSLQYAMKWFNPYREIVNLDELLNQRWDHEELLLDPRSGQLYRPGTLGPGHFGVFSFSISLTPKASHKLVVEYKQQLGWEWGNIWGLRYIMTPARRWDYWGDTLIEIRFPKGWQNVATRPTAKKIGRSKGMELYRIKMGRPVENLYVSAIPAAKKTQIQQDRRAPKSKTKQ